MNNPVTEAISVARLEAGYAALFDPKMRAAHIACLDHARLTRADKWPTVETVGKFARLYGVSDANLGAFFGLLCYRVGSRTVWVDALRGPVHPAVALMMASDEQVKAWGFQKACREAFAGEAQH